MKGVVAHFPSIQSQANVHPMHLSTFLVLINY
jgi:hypothetical protein